MLDAFRRPLFTDRYGRPHFLIGGASPDDPSNAPGGLAAAATSGGTIGTGAAVNEHGYPDNMPWASMQPDQQVKYWQHQARKHEGRAKQRDDYDTIKAERDQLKTANQTEQEKAVQQARDEATTAARAEVSTEFGGRLVAAEFKAEAAGRAVNGKPLDIPSLVAGLNLSYYLTDKGEVDTDKVTQFLDGIAPKPATGVTAQRFPDLGQGQRSTSPQAKKEAGIAEAQRRFAKSTS